MRTFLNNFHPTKVLLSSTGLLLILGITLTYSSSAFVSLDMFGNTYHYLLRQIIFVCLGLILGSAAAYIDPAYYRKFNLHFLAFSYLLLILVLIPKLGLGFEAGGATRWIDLYFFKVQPSEIFKLAIIIHLAASLSRKTGDRKYSHSLISHLIAPILGIGLLLLEPDFGTAVLIILIVFSMLFVAGAQMAYLLAAGFMALPLAYYLIASSPYRLLRIQAFLDPWSHKYSSGYQIVQSLISFGSGQATGTGLGAGTSKLFFLPAAHTDFIFASIGEELGFFGITLIISAFILIAWSGFWTAQKMHHPFEKYLCLGITTALVLQAIINIFVVLGLFPTKGMTLPFISYGGSSMLISCIMFGILIRLSMKASKASTKAPT